MLANPQVEFYNDKFIIHSSSFGDTAFISSVSKDGKLEWLRKIKDKDYENIHIKKVLYMDKSYIAIAEGIKKTSKDLLAIKVTLNGEVEKIEIIENGFKNNIKSALMLDNQIGIITDTFENIKIYYLGSNLKLSNKTYSLNEQPDNVFLTYQPWVVGQVYKDKKLTIILGYMGNTDNNMYKLVVDPLTNKSKLTVHSVFEELGVSTQAISGGSGLLVQRDKKLNLYGTDDKLMNTFDYSKVKIEKLEDYKDKVQLMGEENWDDIKNELTIDNVYLTNGSWLVKTETLFHINFDLFDSNLNIRKRVMLDKSLYEYPDAILLKTFYVNNTIYEVYSYGLETPSIMVSVITMGA